MIETADDYRLPAVFSPCRRYRFSLRREWDSSSPAIAFIGLNPSTADETHNDPTVQRCVNRAAREGFGSMWMLNLFAYRATNPDDMLSSVIDPTGGAQNLSAIEAVCSACRVVVACWGNIGSFRGQDKSVLRMLDEICDVYCLGVTKQGQPKHPLYLPNSTYIQSFRKKHDANHNLQQ